MIKTLMASQLSRNINMTTKRIRILKSPATQIKLPRNIRILLVPKPITWNETETMDGQAMCSKEFIKMYSRAVKKQADGDISHCFQFRAAYPGRLIAKGTIRVPIEGLTSWIEWLNILGWNWKQWAKQLDADDAKKLLNIDIIIDSDVMKVYPIDITEPTIIELPPNFISYHRGDNHNSTRSITSVQFMNFDLHNTGRNHDILNKVSKGDRDAYRDILSIKLNDTPMSIIQRQIQHNLPITHIGLNKIFTYEIASYIKQNVTSETVVGGSKFLCTDPKIPYGTALVPRQLIEKLSLVNGRPHWISVPTISRKCIKPVTIKPLPSDINLIFINSKMARDGYRDFDGDTSKIIKLTGGTAF